MRSVSARLAAIAISVFAPAAMFAQGDPLARAEQLVQAGKSDEALKVYDEAIRKDPTYAPFHVNRGLVNVSMRKWRDALNDCTAALQLQRPTADVHYCRAIALFNTNKVDLARDSVKRALALNPNHAGAIQLQAMVSKKGKDRDEGIASLSELIRVKPTAQAHIDRAKLYEKSGDLLGALEDYSEAVRLEPKEQTIIARAETLTKLGEFDKSIAAYTEMLRRSPNTPTYLVGRGKAFLMKGDEVRATADFNLAKRFNPAYAHIVWQVQAGASTLKRQIAEAKANAVALAEARKTPPAGAPAQTVASAPSAPAAPGAELAPVIEEPAVNRTLVLTRKGQPQTPAPAAEAPKPEVQTAVAPVQKAPEPPAKPVQTAPAQVASVPVQKAPEPAPKPAETPPAQAVAAPVQKATEPVSKPVLPPAQTAEVKPAPPAPVEVAKATPPPAPAPPPAASVTADMEAVRRHLDEAAQHVRAKQPDQAIAAYSAALALKADLPATWVDRAKLHLQAGRFDKAIADFGESLKHKPDQADVWLMRCSANLQAKNPKAAVPDCAKAVDLNPKSAEAVFTRAQAYAATRQFVAAAQDYETTIEKKPEFPEAHMALGQIYIELEQYVLALRHFTIAVQQKPGFKEAYKFRAIVKETLGDTLGRDEDMSKAGA